MRLWTTLAAVSGAVSVAAGAFAAHGIADPVAKDWLHTGAAYEMSHALAALACVCLTAFGMKRARYAPGLFLGGSALFSGSLYAMALGAPRWLGAVTPVGGLLLLAGWSILAWAGVTYGASANPAGARRSLAP